MRHAIWMGLLIGACTGSGTDDTDPTDTVDTTDSEDTDDTAEVEPDCVDDDPLDDPPMLQGNVVDQDGNPASKRVTAVRYCNGAICISAQFQSCDGRYELIGLPDGTGTLEAVPIGDNDHLATVLAPIPVDASTDRTIDMVVPTLTSTHTLTDTPTEYELVDGFFLTVGTGQLEAPSPLEPEATVVAGVDASSVALPFEGGLPADATVEAVYYLDPFDYHTDTGLPVRITNSWGFADGDAQLWVARYAADWELVGDLTVDGNGDLTVAEGLSLISTVAIVRLP
jgi:hypothetical protein